MALDLSHPTVGESVLLHFCLLEPLPSMLALITKDKTLMTKIRYPSS